MRKSGVKVIQQDLRTLLQESHTLAAIALEPLASEITTAAKEITPVETGTLRDSVNVRVSRSPRYPGLIATASALNPRTGYNYAKIQHENPDYHHEAPTQYKYLETALNNEMPKIQEAIRWHLSI